MEVAGTLIGGTTRQPISIAGSDHNRGSTAAPEAGPQTEEFLKITCALTVVDSAGQPVESLDAKQLYTLNLTVSNNLEEGTNLRFCSGLMWTSTPGLRVDCLSHKSRGLGRIEMPELNGSTPIAIQFALRSDAAGSFKLNLIYLNGYLPLEAQTLTIEVR